MSAHHLRCRVCEEVSEPGPGDACPRCDGPTDVAYDWERLARRLDHPRVGRARPREPVALRTASCPRARGSTSAPAGRGSSARSRCRTSSSSTCSLKLENENPTRSYKDRIATVAISAALDHGVTTLCCSSTGNLGDAVAAGAAATGLEAVVLVPAGSASAAVEAEHRGVHVLAVRGTYDDCRRLELELRLATSRGASSAATSTPTRARARRRSRSRSPSSSAGGCPRRSSARRRAERSSRSSTQGFAELTRAASRTSRCRACSPRRRSAPARSRPRSPTTGASRACGPDTQVASLAIGDPSHGDLALGAARATGGSVIAVAEDEIAAYTELLSEHDGRLARRLGWRRARRASLPAVERPRRGAESQVVLVVTGRPPVVDSATAARDHDRPGRRRRARGARPRLVA